MAQENIGNIIDQKAVGDLLCGYEFHIPTYQRGYRWTRQQVIDLCNDLLEYALIDRQKNSEPKAFYSLQPLIVQPHRSQNENSKDCTSYDVIDGQQRLTTIYIMLRFILAELGPTPEKQEKLKRDIVPFSIIYETRTNDTDFIEDLGSEGWEERFLSGKYGMDIDIAHIYNAYQFMKEWLDSTNKSDDSSSSLCERLGKPDLDEDEIARKLLTLLKNKKDTNKSEGNAQFIWYELSSNKDAISEFINENKGKIGLNDTERIRALFLYREDKNNEVDAAQQISIAKDWDEIESTFQDPEFWAFISNQKPETGRISIIFEYLQELDKAEVPKNTIPEDLYRYYVQKFSKKDGNVALREWKRVMETFRMLKNWHSDAYLYNLIGLLIKEGKSITDIAAIYNRMDVLTISDFIRELSKEINISCLPKTSEEAKENEYVGLVNAPNARLEFKGEKDNLHLELFFDEHKDKIRSLLRFLNIRTLCEQIEKHRLKNKYYKGNEYRFAFDLYDEEEWDVEHIDSATTNQLKSEKDKEKWIEQAQAVMKLFDNSIKEKFEHRVTDYRSDKSKFEALHQYVISITDGEKDDEYRKNWIGNLTLLNAAINSGYGNSLFAAKGIKIDEKVNEGAFVPVCTRMVFYKAIPDNENAASKLEWKFIDKKAYHTWMLKKITDFKTLYPVEKESNK